MGSQVDQPVILRISSLEVQDAFMALVALMVMILMFIYSEHSKPVTFGARGVKCLKPKPLFGDKTCC
jgi:hypothetical protein